MSSTIQHPIAPLPDDARDRLDAFAGTLAIVAARAAGTTCPPAPDREPDPPDGHDADQNSPQGDAAPAHTTTENGLMSPLDTSCMGN